MAATQFAADTPLLVTGLIATAGIFALWQLRIYAVAFLLLGAGMGVTLVLRWVWWRITAWAEIAAALIPLWVRLGFRGEAPR